MPISLLKMQTGYVILSSNNLDVQKGNNMKRVLLLGGSKYQIPVIEAIHKLGYCAITCDYLPDNIAHKYSDEYYNVSIIDKEAVLDLAKRIKIDGIMSFACDPGVTVAAYVAEQLGLPTHPYRSVEILQNKVAFRNFLRDNNFNVPFSNGYNSVESAVADSEKFSFPVIVKPTDSAGSKGVTKVENVTQLKSACEYALEYSFSKTFIIEEFIEKLGFSSDTDCFSIDGKLVFCSFDNQYFDLNNPSNIFAPCAYSWPSSMPNEIQVELRSELQRLITLLDLNTSVYNVETRQGKNGKPYIMEFTPRGGGNRLSEMLKYATGTDLILNAVRAAVDDPIEGITGDPIYKGSWAEVILHSKNDGVLVGIEMDSEFKKKYVIEEDYWVSPGTQVYKFTGANFALGTVALKFPNQDELATYMNNIDNYIRVVTK